MVNFPKHELKGNLRLVFYGITTLYFDSKAINIKTGEVKHLETTIHNLKLKQEIRNIKETSGALNVRS